MTAPHPRTARAGRDLRMLRAAVFAAVCVVLAAAGHSLASCASVAPWTLAAGFLGALLVAAPLAGRARTLPGIAALLAVGQTVLHTMFGLGQLGTGGGTASGTMSMGTGSMGSMASMGPTHMGSMGSSMGSMPALSDTELVARAARLVCGTAASALSPAQAYRILVDAHVYGGPYPYPHPVPGTGTGMGTGTVAGMSAMHHHPADALSAGGPVASLLPSLPMLLGHVLAALAAGWLLRRGDLALLRLIELSAHSAHSVAETALVRSLRAALALARALCAGLPATPGAVPRFRRAVDDPPPVPRAEALEHTVIRRGPPTAAAFALAA
ncbi:hypothetical protein [Streptomyces sp. NPDC004065]|uniref:hypothetical protein n=1 Tax=Streptomyces sp. NPDC004065 TaxID=3364689 RepID=UPI00384FBF0F